MAIACGIALAASASAYAGQVTSESGPKNHTVVKRCFNIGKPDRQMCIRHAKHHKRGGAVGKTEQPAANGTVAAQSAAEHPDSNSAHD